MSRWSRDCYYCGACDFPRRRGIDAAILGTRHGIRLFVNSFSPNRERFRVSKLYRDPDSHGAVCDPELLAQQGRAFVVDVDLGPVADGHSRWGFLKDRYGVLTSKMIESEFRGVLCIAREDIERGD